MLVGHVKPVIETSVIAFPLMLIKVSPLCILARLAGLPGSTLVILTAIRTASCPLGLQHKKEGREGKTFPLPFMFKNIQSQKRRN